MHPDEQRRKVTIMSTRSRRSLTNRNICNQRTAKACICTSSRRNVLTPARRVFTVCTFKQQYTRFLSFWHLNNCSESPARHYFCYPAALVDISVPPYIDQVTYGYRINSVKDADMNTVDLSWYKGITFLLWVVCRDLCDVRVLKREGVKVRVTDTFLPVFLAPS